MSLMASYARVSDPLCRACRPLVPDPDRAVAGCRHRSAGDSRPRRRPWRSWQCWAAAGLTAESRPAAELSHARRGPVLPQVSLVLQRGPRALPIAVGSGTESRCRWLAGNFLWPSAGGAVADGLHLRVFVQGLLVIGCRGLEVEHDLLHGSGEGVRGLVLIGEVDDQAVVAADVHACVAGEGNRDGVGHHAFADLPLVGP